VRKEERGEWINTFSKGYGQKREGSGAGGREDRGDREGERRLVLEP